MRLKSIRFLKEGDFVLRAGERLEIIEVNEDNDYIAYKGADNKMHYTTGNTFFSEEIRG